MSEESGKSQAPSSCASTAHTKDRPEPPPIHRFDAKLDSAPSTEEKQESRIDSIPPPAGRRAHLALAAVCVITALSWVGVLTLPLTGEDFVMLGRAARGESSSPHVFRPAADLWLAGLHGVFGVSSATPYHVGSLLLHLACVVLAHRIAKRLFSCEPAAFLAALAFGVSAAATDGLAWIAAVNRPLSGLGAMLAILGALVLVDDRRRGWALVALGFLLQLASNEEAFGTALLLVLLCACASWRSALVAALGLAVVLTGYFLFLRTGDHLALPELRMQSVWTSFLTRHRLVLEGLGLPPPLSLLLPVIAGAILLARGKRRAALVVVAAWACAFVPFVLVEPSRYRFYPSLLPAALLLAAAVTMLVPKRGWPPVAGLATAVFLLVSTHHDRADRLSAWRAALREVSVCAEAAEEMARERGTPPVLLNLELSSFGPFFYHFGFEDPAALPRRHFLDAASGFADPGRLAGLPPGPWWGRRSDGTYGWIETDEYLDRPRLEDLLLVEEAVLVSSLEEARERLADPTLDLRRTAVLEADRLALDLDAMAEPAPSLAVLAPFITTVENRRGRSEVRVRLERPALLVYHANWMFDSFWRVSPDQALLVDAAGTRRIELVVKDLGSGERFSVHRANAFGFAVELPAGDRDLALEFELARIRGAGRD